MRQAGSEVKTSNSLILVERPGMSAFLLLLFAAFSWPPFLESR